MKKFELVHSKYKNLILDIKKYFSDSDVSIHKARNEIKMSKYNNQEVIIKSFRIPNIINQIVYSFFRKSKALKSYENSLRISSFVPPAIAYVEYYSFGLFKNSYFVSENFKYDFTIREVLINDMFPDKLKILKQFSYFTSTLHASGIYHLDYSPGNILIKILDDKYEFKIVDINRMQFKELTLNDKLNNFSKLWAKNEDLKIIIEAYADIINEDEVACVKVALAYSSAHKNRINAKKRRRGQEVND